MFITQTVKCEVLPIDKTVSWWRRLFFGRLRYRTLEPVVYITRAGERMDIWEGGGYVTDFGTIPRIAWFFLHPLDPRFIREYLLHDFAITHLKHYSRSMANDLLEEALEDGKAPETKARAVLFFVRLWKD